MVALRTGLLVQAILTGVGMVWLRAAGTPLQALSGGELLQVSLWVLIAPSWAGGIAAGWTAQKIRARHLLTSGALVALVFLLSTSLALGSRVGEFTPLFRLWLAGMLVIHPAIAGIIAHSLRNYLQARDPLQPRPYRAPRELNRDLDLEE